MPKIPGSGNTRTLLQDSPNFPPITGDSKVLFILFGQHGRTALSGGPGYSASAFSSGKGILHNPIADPWHPQSKRKSIQEPLPSRELTYPPDKAYLKMMFLFPQVGYDNFLEGI